MHLELKKLCSVFGYFSRGAENELWCVCLLRWLSGHSTKSNIQRLEMVEVLQSIRLDNKDVRVIVNLYSSHSSNKARIWNWLESWRIQGCILSALLFNFTQSSYFGRLLRTQAQSSSIDKGSITLDTQMTQLSSLITQRTCKSSWYELRWSVSNTV